MLIVPAVAQDDEYYYEETKREFSDKIKAGMEFQWVLSKFVFEQNSPRGTNVMTDRNRKTIDQESAAIGVFLNTEILNNQMPEKHRNRMEPSVQATFAKNPRHVFMLPKKGSSSLKIAPKKP